MFLKKIMSTTLCAALFVTQVGMASAAEETGQGKMEKIEHKDKSSAKGRKGEKRGAGRKHQSTCDQRLRYGAQIEIAQSLAAG